MTINDDPWPPSDAKPGDVWGAYVRCRDGWWRLNGMSALAILTDLIEDPHNNGDYRLNVSGGTWWSFGGLLSSRTRNC